MVRVTKNFSVVKDLVHGYFRHFVLLQDMLNSQNVAILVAKHSVEGKIEYVELWLR